MPRHTANKRPKDPNAPKKSQSSYFIFSNERRPVLQAEQSGTISVTEISKTISSEWKAMDATQKKVYEDRAAILKSEYNIKFDEYKQSDNYRKYQLQLAEWKETSKDILKSKGKPPKKPKQPESMPKRPQSSYFVFSNERRSQMKSEYPDKKLTELSVIIAGEWKNKTAEEKKYYEEEAAKNKIKYQSEIEQYKKTKEYDLYQERVEEWKLEKKRWDSGAYIENDANTPKISLPRKPKDSKCPKRALTSYFLYAKEIRGETKLEFPDKPITEIAKEISKKWKVLTEDEKKPYVAEAERLKAAYKIEAAEYEGSDSQIQFKTKLQEWKLECDRRKQAAKAKAAKAKINKKKSPKGKGKNKKNSPQKNKNKGRKQKMDTDSDSDSSSSSGSYSSSGSDSDSSSSGSDSDSSSSSGSSSD
eukprot:29014_1